MLRSTSLAKKNLPSAGTIMINDLLRAAVDLSRAPRIGVQPCASMAEYSVGFGAATFTEEIVRATRKGAKDVPIDGFFGERVEDEHPKIDYWLDKIRMSGGSVFIRDVTTTQSIAGP